jgi:IS30 family transposase
VTLVKYKIGYTVLPKVKNKTSNLVSSAIMTNLKPLAPLVKTMIFDNGKEICRAR